MGSFEPLASFRLKTKRRRKRLQKKDQEKHQLALHREERKIRKQIRELGYEPLIPPIQKGYKRLFILREDVKRSPQSDFFEGILKKINTVQYSDTKAFTRKKRRRGRKIQVPREQKLREFYDYEWKNKKLTEAEAFYFTQVIVWHPVYGFRIVYQFNEPWRFVLKVVPNLITEVKIKDYLLEQREDEIDRYFSYNKRREKLNRLLGMPSRYYWDWVEKSKYQSPIKNKSLTKILSELEE